MKKLLFIFAVATFTLSMTACGGKSSTNTTADDAAATTTTETTTSSNDSEALAKYEAIINKMIKLYEDGKLQSGDASAMQEYTKIAQEMTDISEQLQKDMQNLTPAQLQKFSDLGQKLADAATKAMQ